MEAAALSGGAWKTAFPVASPWRRLQAQETLAQAELCSFTTWMRVMYWISGAVWIALFMIWAASVFSPGKRRRGLRLFLFLCPVVQFGSAFMEAHLFTICPCFHCTFSSDAAFRSFRTAYYAFYIGRLAVFPLCLYVIATGCGTIHAKMPRRGWFVLLLGFGSFIATVAVFVESEDISYDTSYYVHAAVVCLICLIVIAEAVGSCKVLKAQLMMIAQQNIDPRTCPAWWKFHLFERLRKYCCWYLLVNVVLTVAQRQKMPGTWYADTGQKISTTIWEVMHVGIAVGLGWVFGGTAPNYYLETERHMRSSEVTQPLAASDMTIGWREDVSAMFSANDAALASWNESVAVPPPPQPLPLIDVLPLGRTANTAAVQRARAARPPPRATTPAQPAPAATNATDEGGVAMQAPPPIVGVPMAGDAAAVDGRPVAAPAVASEV